MQLIITNAGEELISRLISETAAAQFTKISASDHDYSGADPKMLTELDNVKQTVLISGISRIDTTLVEIIAAFDNKGLETGYYARALGVYAEDQDGNEILFCVGVDPDHPSYLPPFSGRTVSSITYRLKIKVNNSEQVNIEVNPGAYPTVEQFSDLQKQFAELSEKVGLGIAPKLISVCERDPGKPDYLDGNAGGGGDDGGELISEVTLMANDYSGSAEITLVMSDGVKYDAENMSRSAENAQNGDVIIQEV